MPNTLFPTPEHQHAANAIVELFRGREAVEAVLLVNSCARGKACRDSCLDIAILLSPSVFRKYEMEWENEWETHFKSMTVFRALEAVGKNSTVHLYFTGGEFVPGERQEVGEPDSFEVEVGNCLVYSVPLWNGSNYFETLRTQWLPYYGEALRQERLQSARWHCLNDLDQIPLCVRRGLYFQAFERLQLAFKSFLQGLFISHRTYPIAYNKWIEEQIVDILQLPDLHRSLPRLFELNRFESDEIVEKAQLLGNLVEQFIEVPNLETDPNALI